MPERPPGPGPDDREEPEYGWLYGGSGSLQQPPPSDDPEPTRMIRAQQRPGPEAEQADGRRTDEAYAQPRSSEPRSTERPRRAAAPPRLPSDKTSDKTSDRSGDRSGGLTGTRTGTRDRLHRIGARRIILSVLALWLVFLVAVPVWAWSRIDRVDATPTAARPADQPGTTYLLVGSDSRKGLSKEQRRKLGTGDAAGQRTDTIMLLHVGSGPNVLLSIPRDSLVPIPGHGTTKINAAYAYGGPKLLTRTVEQNTGVRVDDYVEIGMGGVVNAVDAVGGVRICTPKRLDDKLANLHLSKGCHPHADGATALGYSRSRHTQSLGDIDRAANQRKIVSQVGDKVKSPLTVLNPFRYLAVAKAGSNALTIGEGTSPVALARFAWAMSHVTGSSGKTCSMPISDLAVHWDRDRALALMNLIKTDRTSAIPARLCTESGLPG